MPIGQQASEEVRPSQNGAVRRCRPPDHDMVAPTGSNVSSVEHELLRTQTCLPYLLIENLRGADEFDPVRGGLNVDFNNAWVRCHFQMGEPKIGRRAITFDHHWHLEFSCGPFDRSDQIDVILQQLNW